MVLAAGAAMVWTSHVGAAHALVLTNEVFQEIEIKGPNGKIERKTVPANKVVPGTEVFYVITYKNDGDKPAEKVIVTNPVPKELEYVTAASIAGESAAEVSVDGGKNYGALSRLTVAGADGKPRPATTSDVTHVRWSLKSIVEPGDEGKVSFRAKLK
jgi:uncharacterized repeat protein (TIGR01451 family)